MNAKLRYVGLDVHAGSIVIAIAESGGRLPAEVWKTLPYNPPRLLEELRRLGPLSALRVCYEAGPTGFGLQRYLAQKGVSWWRRGWCRRKRGCG
jgi:hypothetical protein